MATITRGRDFTNRNIVNAADLHQLIDGAVVTGLTLDDFTGTVKGVGTVAPATPQEGDVWRANERLLLTTSTYSDSILEENFLVQTAMGAVALFHPYGFETRRFVASSDTATWPAGSPAFMETGQGGATLAAFNNNLVAGQVGLGYAGINSRAHVASGETGRLTVIGLCAITRKEASVAPANSWAMTFRRVNDATKWSSTSATNLLGTFCLQLSDLDAADATVPGYAWGGPLWRT